MSRLNPRKRLTGVAAAAVGAFALLSAVSVPAAAAEVTVFGTVDTFIAVQNTQGDVSTALMSGGLSPTHVGIEGSEELGNGLEVFFKLDSAVLSDEGQYPAAADGRLFNREAALGLRGSFGELSFGRLYMPHFLTFIIYDPNGLSIGSSDGGFFFPGPHSTCGDTGNLVRADNSVSWVLPTSFGLTNFFFASLGENQKADGSTSSTRGNVYNYAAKLDRGPFSGMASFLWEDGAEGLAGSARAGEKYDAKYLSVAANYDLGFTRPVIEYVKKWGSAEHGSSTFWMVQLGTATPVAGGTWTVTGSYLKNETRDDADAWGLGTKFIYPLSKRTSVYTGMVAVFNGDKSGYVPEAGTDSSLHFNYDASNMIGGTGYGTDYLGKNVQAFFVGMKHDF